MRDWDSQRKSGDFSIQRDSLRGAPDWKAAVGAAAESGTVERTISSLYVSRHSNASRREAPVLLNEFYGRLPMSELLVFEYLDPGRERFGKASCHVFIRRGFKRIYHEIAFDGDGLAQQVSFLLQSNTVWAVLGFLRIRNCNGR